MSTETLIRTWLIRIERVNQQVQESFGDLSQEALNQKPSENVWSVAENLQHITQVNESYYPVIEKLKSGNLKLGWMRHIDLIRKLTTKLILQSVEPTRKRKISTFTIWEPDHTDRSADCVERFLAHQKEFSIFIKSCHHLLESGEMIHSPANHRIIYDLESAFEIIVTHEERHVNQALEAKAALNLPKTE